MVKGLKKGKGRKVSFNEVVKSKIIELLKNSVNPLSKRQIATELNISHPTAAKYVDILVGEGKLKLIDYGPVHAVSVKDGK